MKNYNVADYYPIITRSVPLDQNIIGDFRTTEKGGVVVISIGVDFISSVHVTIGTDTAKIIYGEAPNDFFEASTLEEANEIVNKFLIEQANNLIQNRISKFGKYLTVNELKEHLKKNKG